MISMLGSAPLVLLDEPSTGMDPQSKRFLWDMITQNFGGDRSAVLTTHSMEEADALCDRICIIVNGTMQCIGSSQHLKDKYGSGYMLEIRIKVPKSGASTANFTTTSTETMQQRVKTEVSKLFPKAVCTEQLFTRMVFTVAKDQIQSLGTAFADLDKSKTLCSV